MKELFEITKFVTGTISTPDIKDISDDAASYSKNLDSVSEDGKLTGIPIDTTQVSSINASKLLVINDGGTYRAVYFDGADDKIKKIDDLYGTPAAATLSSAAESVTGTPCMQVNNKEVHIGMGKGSDDKPLWAGIIPHGQFGDSAPSGLQLEEAELEPPSEWVNFHKAVQDTTYIYAIPWQGTYIYKFRLSDNKFIGKSVFRFEQTQGLALGHSSTLWVFDAGQGTYGTLYRLDRDGMETSVDIALDSSGNTDFSDLQETGDATANYYLWFSKPTNGAWATASDTMIRNIAYQNNLDSSGTLGAGGKDSLTPRLPYVGDAGGLFVGAWWTTSEGTTGCGVDLIVPKTAFCNMPHDVNQVGWITHYRRAGGGYAYLCYDVLENGALSRWAINTIENDHTSNTRWDQASGKARVLFLSGLNLSNDIVRSVCQTDYSLLISYYSPSSDEETELYVRDEVWGNETFGSFLGDATETNDANKGSVKRACITADDGAQCTVNMFTSMGTVGWATCAWNGLSWGSFTAVKQPFVWLTITNSGSADTDWTATYEYFWKCSFLYDGYQESPLSVSFTITSPAAETKDIIIDIKNISVLNQRITHVILYRAESSVDGSTTPEGYYRLVKSFKLDTNFREVTDSFWGNYRTRNYEDNYSQSSSYEALVGISEVLGSTIINYSLSAQLNNVLFVCKGYHPDIEDAENFLFKSQPYNFNQFDWGQDLLRLPTRPTAIAAFNGRIYVFDKNNTYRIEPNNLYIEDIYEGVGCIGPDAVLVTEYGMCFCDKNNIYLHDGRRPVPIGEPILRGNANHSWQKIDSTSYTPKIMFDGQRNSFVIFYKVTVGGYYAWAYNIARKRWDMWVFHDTNVPTGILAGKNGEMFISDGTNLLHFLGHASDKRSWEWWSKDLTMNIDTIKKKFYDVSGVGGFHAITYGVDGDTTPTTALVSGKVAVGDKKSKSIRLKIVPLLTPTSEVDSVGIVYRRLPITSGNI